MKGSKDLYYHKIGLLNELMTSSKKHKTYTHHDIINQRPQTKNKKNLYQF